MIVETVNILKRVLVEEKAMKTERLLAIPLGIAKNMSKK